MITESYASGTVPLPTDTIRVLEEKILLALNAGGGGGGGGGGSGQIKTYTTTDPTTDGVFPDDQTKPAFAYKKDGTGPSFGWDTDALAWV